MSRPWMIVGIGVLAIAGIAATSIIYYERPQTLTVAVAPADVEDFALINATAKLLQQRHTSLRFKVLQTDDITASSAALDDGRADLAVVRADVAMPSKGGTVVLTHKDAGVLLAPAGSEVTKVEELAGKRVGILSSRPGDAHILDIEIAQYGVPANAVTIVPLDVNDIQAELTAKSVDAVFAVGPVTDGMVPTAVKAVTKAGNGPPIFLPVAEAPAIVQRSPAYDSIEVVKGIFEGSPVRPADEFNTLGVTYRLVASTELSDHTVAALTRFLLNQRVALAQLEPSAIRMEAPATTKGQAQPVHAGTAEYIDDKEETFLEQYSDFIYLGAMLMGVGATGLTALFTRIGASGAARVEDLVAHLVSIMKLVRLAKDTTELDGLDEEVDGAVAAALEESCFRTMDERRVAALNMAVEQARSAIRDRRKDLLRNGAPANEVAPTAFEPKARLVRPGADGPAAVAF